MEITTGVSEGSLLYQGIQQVSGSESAAAIGEGVLLLPVGGVIQGPRVVVQNSAPAVRLASQADAARTGAGEADDILLLGRGTPDVLKPMADQLGARVIDTQLRGKELYKHIYGEMRKADGLIQITDGIPNALVLGQRGQWSRMEKLLIDNVEKLRAKTVRGSKADFSVE